MSELPTLCHKDTRYNPSTACVSGEKPVEYTDRGLMHLTQSFITEILRITVAVMSLDHYTTEDVEIHGVKIPKGTVNRIYRQGFL